MGERGAAGAGTTTPSPPPVPTQPLSLVQPSNKKKKNKKVFRVFRSVFRSFPILSPAACRFPSLPGGLIPEGPRTSGGGSRITGTLFGYRKGRVSLSVQENSKTLPTAVVELAMHTHALQKEMGMGMVRIALECEKRPEKERTKLLDEPLWTVYCNGRKTGYGVRREPTEEDLYVMEVLRAVSMGAGVLPGKNNEEAEAEGGSTGQAAAAEAEISYMRAHFDHVVGSKDSETLYMLSPDGSNGPELSIFFVRI